MLQKIKTNCKNRLWSNLQHVRAYRNQVLTPSSSSDFIHYSEQLYCRWPRANISKRAHAELLGEYVVYFCSSKQRFEVLVFVWSVNCCHYHKACVPSWILIDRRNSGTYLCDDLPCHDDDFDGLDRDGLVSTRYVPLPP